MKPGLPVVYLTVFLDLVGFGIILPLLPFYAEAFGATGIWVGAILTAYSAAQLAGASLLGRLSDRVGRRPVLLMSLAGSAASLLLCGLARSLWLLLAARALAGLFGGSIAAAQAYIADVTTPGERARYMGLLGASIGLGFVFGPALGSALARFGFGAAAFAAAALAAANLLFALFRLPETRPAEVRQHGHSRVDWSNFLDALHHPAIGRLLAATFLSTLAFVAMEATFALLGEVRFGLDAGRLGFVFGPALGSGLARFGFGAAAFAAASLAAANLVFAFFRLPETRGPEERRHAHARVDLSNLLDALHHPSTGRLLAATFLSTLAFVAMEATFALLGEARFGLDASRLGLVFAYVGVVMVIVQGGLVGRLAPRFGERALATAGALVMGASLAALPLVPSLGAAYVVLAGLAVGQGLTTPMLATLLSRATDADEQGGTLGLGQSLAAAARAVGPIGAGWLYDRAVAAPYAASAAVMVLAALLVGTARTD